MIQAKGRDSGLRKHLLQASNDSLQSAEELYDARFRGNVNDVVLDDSQQEMKRSSSDEESPWQLEKTAGALPDDSNSSLEREIAALKREMDHITLDCQEIIESRTDDQARCQAVAGISTRPDFFKSPRMVPKMGTRLDYMRQVRALQEGLDPAWPTQSAMHLYEEIPESHFCDKVKGFQSDDRDHSPVKGTAQDLGIPSSLNLTLEFHQRRWGKDESPLLPELPLVMLDTCSSPEKSVSLSRSPSSHSVNRLSQTDDEGVASSLQQVYAQYADVMYTNSANLQHTIQVQQQLFQQQLGHRASSRKHHRSKSSRGGHPEESAIAKLGPPAIAFPSHKVEMKWVVKKRADGSRYITRRPIRSKLLKKRAWIVAAERAGTTTDDSDDATSELKVGRYWPKEERKRHLERARDHKRKKELTLRQKMEALRELEEAKKLSTAAAAVTESSKKRTPKRKGKKLVEDFTAIQELLVHGNRDGQQTSSNNPLLSVTTV